MPRRLRVGVISGGQSGEHGVSLDSARSIRRPPQPPEEDEPFVPPEPWWRKPRPETESERSPADRATRRFQETLPRQPTRVTMPAIRMQSRAGIAVVVGAVLIALMAVLLTYDGLAVSRSGLTIRGAQRVPQDVIYAASGVDGVNVFRVDPRRTAERVRQVTGIADATVHVQLPGRVIISVREHVPFVAWRSITTTIWLAETGSVVPVGGDLPPLSLIDTSGAAADADGRLRPIVLENLKALRAAGLEVTELYYGAREGLYFRSADGWTVYLGSEGQMSAKLAALQEIKTSSPVGKAPMRIVDLRFDGRAQLK